MRTTLNLDEELVRELMKVTEAKTKTAAIHQAISEAIRRRKLDQLKSLSGKVRVAADWKKSEQAEIRRQNRLMRQWHGAR